MSYIFSCMLEMKKASFTFVGYDEGQVNSGDESKIN